MVKHALLSLTASCFLALGCTTSRPQFVPGQDSSAYISAHPELQPNIASAILNGEIVPGMSAADMIAAGGAPALRSRFPASDTEVWLVSSSRLGLGHFRFHNAPMLRVAFIRGRVASVQLIQ